MKLDRRDRGGTTGDGQQAVGKTGNECAKGNKPDIFHTDKIVAEASSTYSRIGLLVHACNR